jgi:hypothetical protein
MDPQSDPVLVVAVIVDVTAWLAQQHGEQPLTGVLDERRNGRGFVGAEQLKDATHRSANVIVVGLVVDFRSEDSAW